MRLLDEVPEALLVLCELAVAKVLLDLLLDVGRLLLPSATIYYERTTIYGPLIQTETDLCGGGGVRLLDEVPEALLVLCELAVAKVLLDLLLDVGRLLLQLLHHVLLPRVELVLTAHLN